ncbi:MAG: IPT/TIG domain-containing protein [Deltaproteobacteria bacterium]|nr:IPT/TIG domain-containing protein [Deltaproteobacteria bacterium]
MRLRPWLLVAALSASAYAQPDPRDHRRDHRGGGGVGINVGVDVHVGGEPTEAPPPPPAEPHDATRAGFVWVTGSYEWKDGKYSWVPGHWERERAGKKWRETRWEQRDGKWVRTEGDWIDASATATAGTAAGAPPPPPPPEEHPLPPNGNPGVVPPTVRDHRHDWKLDRPTVSSYWPTKGKAGSKVVIHGMYFPAEASVLVNGKKLTGAVVAPTTIEFLIPGDVTGTADIAIDRGHGRPLQVGSFDVDAGFDWAAEQQRIDDDRRKHAEAEWSEQQKTWAKDRAAREAAFHQREQELEQTRDHRREKRMEEIRAKWNASFLADADTQDELTLHAQRLAELARMKDVASVSGDAKLGVRITVAQQKENDRHAQRMAALETAFKTKGGAP